MKTNFSSKQTLLAFSRKLMVTLVTACIAISATAQQYCIPTSTSDCSDGDEVNSFILYGANGTFFSDLNTGCAPSMLDDRTSLSPVDLRQSLTYTANLSSVYTSDYAVVWIDFNDDFTFSTSERVYAANNFISAIGTNIDLAIPATANLGLHRMRVMVGYPGFGGNAVDFGPCNDGSFVVDYGEMHDYMVNIISPPTCLIPTALTVSNITTTSTTVSWTASAAAPANGYDYYYTTSSIPPLPGTTPNGSVNAGVTTADLPGLSSGTTYNVWLRSKCSTTDNSDWTSVIFSTDCVTDNIPYTAPLTSAIPPGLPNCMSSAAVAGLAWETANMMINGFSGNALKNEPDYDNYEDADSWVFTNGLNLTGGVSYRLSYNFGSGEYGMEKLNVSYGTAATAAGMTNLLADFPNITQNTSSDQYVDFTPTTTGIYYIGFHSYSEVDYAQILYLSNIQVSASPSCIEPLNVVATNIANTTATLSWTGTATAPAGGYLYYYNTTGVAPTTGTAPNGTTANLTVDLTTLTPNTQYHYWVRSKCSATDSSSLSAGTFRTMCDPDLLPYTAPIAAVTTPALPECMTIQTFSGNSWKTANINSNGFSGKVLKMEPDYNTYYDADSWVFTNGLNLTAGTSYRLSYTYGNDGYGEEQMSVKYGNSPNAAGMVTQLANYSAINSGSATNAYFDFIPTTTGLYYFGFHATTSLWMASELYLNNIKVIVSPTCMEPTNLVVSAITNSSASISWTAPTTVPANGYNYYYNTTGTVPTSTTAPSGSSTTTTASLNTLSPNSLYYVWVQSKCSATDSSLLLAGTFKTLCLPENIPYLAPLGTATNYELPDCMNGETISGSDWMTVDPMYDIGVTGYGITALAYLWDSYEDADSWVYTNGLNLTAGTTYELKYKYGCGDDWYTEKMNVKYGTSPSASAMSNQLADHPNIINMTPASNSVTFTAATTGVYYIGFHAYSNMDEYALLLDSIQVNEIAPCPITEVNLGNDTAICAGSSLTLDAGNAGMTYLWNDNSSNQTLNVTTAGTYSVMVSNGSCSLSDTIDISINPLPSADSIIVVNTGECNFTFSAENPQNTTGYNWNFGDGMPNETTATVNHNYTENNNFVVVLTLTNDCGTTTIDTTIECSGVGIKNIDLEESLLKLYPNPTSDKITIENTSSLKMESISVFNILGKVVYQSPAQMADKHQMDVSKLASGLYTVQIKTNNGLIVRKFEVMK